MEQRRYHYVDLARGGSALVVLVGHYRWFYAQHPGQWVQQGQAQLPSYEILWPFYEYVQSAVQMFWLISGFVFYVTYGEFGKRVDGRSFFVHRLARLYPLHFATLIWIAAVQFLGMRLNGQWQVYGNNDLLHFIAQIGFASNWLDSKDFSFNAPIWSVSIEVLIYALYVIVLRYLGNGFSRLVTVAITLIIIERLTYAPLAWCGALFFIGALVAQIMPNMNRLFGRWIAALALVAVVGAIGALVVVRWSGFGGHEATLIAYVVMPPLLMFLAALDLTARPVSPNLLWIGAITYSVYLLHMPMMITAKTFFPDAFRDYSLLRSPITFATYLLIVVCCALVVTYGFEFPMQRKIRAFFGDRRHPTPMAEPSAP